MSAPVNKAVFLSYASQDAEAAKRICESLRQAGVEVWFDQNELVGGDAWDAKIRRQVAACQLFLPIISANTQARLEGYFRIEWKLAAQRTHAMADEKAFLLPVVLDETRDAEARVPVEFKAVQWTRLSGGAIDAAFRDRVRRLLDSADLAPPVGSAPTPEARRKPAWSWHWSWFVVAGAAMVIAAIGAWEFRPDRAREARNPELAKAAALFDFDATDTTAEKFALAEDILKAELAKRPADVDGVILYAWLNELFIIRGFDVSSARAELARRYSERAVQLAPRNADAIAARGIFYMGSDSARAAQLLTDAIALNPRNPRYYRMLSFALGDQHRREEALANAQRALALFPDNALVHYDYGLLQLYEQQFEGAEKAFVETLPLVPRTSLLYAGLHADLASFAAFLHADLGRMKEWLDRMPKEFRDHDREAWPRFIHALGSRQPDEALATLRGMTGTWLRNYGEMPKTLIAGDLLVLQGKAELARVEYEAAQAEVAQALAAEPGKIRYRLLAVWTRYRLGKIEDARAALPSIVAAMERPQFDPLYPAEYWYGPLAASLVLGDKETAMLYLRKAANTPGWRRYFRNMMQIDPRVAAWRDDPEISAVLRHAEMTVSR